MGDILNEVKVLSKETKLYLFNFYIYLLSTVNSQFCLFEVYNPKNSESLLIIKFLFFEPLT